MRILSLILLGLILFSTAPARASDWSDCEANEPKRAIRGCTRVLANKKETPADRAVAYYNRGLAYLNSGNYDASIADNNQAIRLAPKDADSYNNRANAYERKGDRKAALADYSKAIDLDSKKSDFLVNRAVVYFDSREFDKAIADYNAALRVNPKDLNALIGRGASRSELGEFDKAITDFDKAIALKADDALVYYNKAIAVQGKEQFEQALVLIDRSLSLNSEDADAHLRRSAILFDLQRFDAALVEAENVIKLKPDGIDGYNMKCWTLATKQRFDDALPVCDHAVEINPDEFVTRHSRAVVYRGLGQFDRALADFNRSMEIDPTQMLNFADRGKTYELMGEMDKALADFRKALTLRARDYEDRQARNDIINRLASLAAAPPSAAAAPVAAIEPPVGARVDDRRIALVIGNSAYRSSRALTNPRRDARSVAIALRRIGFDSVTEKYDLDLAELSEVLKQFGDEAEKADWAVVYYAGHGIEVGGVNYLVPTDAKLRTSTHVEEEAIPLRRVLSKVEGARKLRLVILDACRDNPFLRTMKVAGATRSVGRGLARVEPGGGVLVAYAARDGQVAQDGDGSNSPYAQALVKHLAEPGLEISLLFRKVRDTVWTLTNGEQEPFTYGSLPSEALYFRAANR